MQLTEHFSLAELTASETAARKGIDNTPGPEVVAALTNTAQGLERIRALVGKPLHVNSGYRSPKVNASVGGVVTSQHCKGEAADITCPGMAVLDLARLIADNREALGADQVIYEFKSWVHVSFTENPRLAVLTIDREGTRNGLA